MPAPAARVPATLIGVARSNANFTDASLAELTRRQGMSVATFDADFGGLGVTLLAP